MSVLSVQVWQGSHRHKIGWMFLAGMKISFYSQSFSKNNYGIFSGDRRCLSPPAGMTAPLTRCLNPWHVAPFPLWVISHPSENGLKMASTDTLSIQEIPIQLASRILDALNNHALREDAAKRNREIIENRASRKRTLPKIDSFYQHFLSEK